MAFNFSANQFDLRFRAPGLCNWEYPRFSPPRPRSLKLNAKPVADNKGHLLPTAQRDGNSFGNFRSTYELPLRITRSFCTRYNACLSGRYKYRDYPRDLCSCQRENPRARACDNRETLGIKGDPYWDRPKCPPKCEAIQQLLKQNENFERCRRPKCIIKQQQADKSEKTDKLDVSMPKPKGENTKKERKRLRHRNVTAFSKTRKIAPGNDSSSSRVAKGKAKSQGGSKPGSKPSNKRIESKAKKEATGTSGNSAVKGKSSKTSHKKKAHNKEKSKDTTKDEKTIDENNSTQKIPQECC